VLDCSSVRRKGIPGHPCQQSAQVQSTEQRMNDAFRPLRNAGRGLQHVLQSAKSWWAQRDRKNIVHAFSYASRLLGDGRRTEIRVPATFNREAVAPINGKKTKGACRRFSFVNREEWIRSPRWPPSLPSPKRGSFRAAAQSSIIVPYGNHQASHAARADRGTRVSRSTRKVSEAPTEMHHLARIIAGNREQRIRP